MDKEDLKKAFIKGKKIQFYDDFHGWVDTDYPMFSADKKYRIKPKP